jgi:hypothetical protein
MTEQTVNFQAMATAHANSMDLEATKPFHYFVTSFANWRTGSDLLDVLKRQAKADKADGRIPVKECYVWRVPGVSRETHYAIENYKPKVEGAEFLDVVVY